MNLSEDQKMLLDKYRLLSADDQEFLQDLANKLLSGEIDAQEFRNRLKERKKHYLMNS